MIRSVEIKGLRGIREGKLDELTPLVVLVGPNGSGKSTVLDALLLGIDPNPTQVILSFLDRTKDLRRGPQWLLWRGEESGDVDVSVGTASGNIVKSRLTVTPTGSAPELQVRFSRPSPDDDSARGRGFREGHAANSRPILTIGENGSMSYGSNKFEHPALPIIHTVDGFQRSAGPKIHDFYTEVVRRGQRADALALISEVVPQLTGIEILTEANTPVLYLVLKDGAVPVVLAGEGTRGLIGMCLELAASPDGVVLMEEPEVHQHPRAIWQSARAIWAAVRRGIQVVLSTHSLELIDALLAESKDDEELQKLSVYRLQLDDGLLKSVHESGTDAAFARANIDDDLR